MTEEKEIEEEEKSEEKLDKIFVEKHPPEVYNKILREKLKNTEDNRIALLKENQQLKKFLKILEKEVLERLNNLERRMLKLEWI